MELVAIKPHGYAGRTIAVGEHYEASRAYAVALTRAGISRLADGEELSVRPAEYDRKDLQATPVGREKPIKKKRQYKRRDMNPKD